MKKKELSTMTVLELKALAKKKKISLPAGAKKANIVASLSKGTSPASGRKATVPLKSVGTATSTKVAAKKRSSGKATAAKKTAAPKKAVSTMRPIARKKAAAETAASVTKKTAVKNKTIATKTGQLTAGQAPVRRPWQIPSGVQDPRMEQERVEDAKYYTGTAEQRSSVTFDSLTHEYGNERMALMARDPYMAFSYWELPQARLEKEKAWFGWDSKLCIRVYDVTGVLFDGTNATAYFDQEVYERVGSWYFDFSRPMHSFCADLGLLSPDGRFLTMVRSNAVTMPRDGVSEVLDEEWMLVDEEFMRLYGIAGAVSGGFSSQQVQELISKRRMLEITSPGLFSKQKDRKK